MGLAKSFRDLRVYKRSQAEARRLFRVSRTFPKAETYALTDQMRRSSRAVSALLAEGWGRRNYKAAFVNKLSQALAETMETQAWLDHANKCEYIDDELHEELDEKWQHIAAMLNKMMQQADSFCD